MALRENSPPMVLPTVVGWSAARGAAAVTTRLNVPYVQKEDSRMSNTKVTLILVLSLLLLIAGIAVGYSLHVRGVATLILGVPGGILWAWAFGKRTRHQDFRG